MFDGAARRIEGERGFDEATRASALAVMQRVALIGAEAPSDVRH